MAARKSGCQPQLLITVSGPDGSGKSTQIQLLLEEFERQGLRATSVWFRPGYSPLLDRLRARVRAKVPAALPTVANPAARENAFSRPWVRISWAALAIADSALHQCVRLRLLRATYDVVLCDRGLEDAALDLRLRFPELAGVASAALRLVGMVGARSDVAIVYSLPLQVAVQRCLDKNEPFADPLEIREARHKFYERLAAQPTVVRVDATRAADVVHRETIAAVLNRPGCPRAPLVCES